MLFTIEQVLYIQYVTDVIYGNQQKFRLADNTDQPKFLKTLVESQNINVFCGGIDKQLVHRRQRNF